MRTSNFLFSNLLALPLLLATIGTTTGCPDREVASVVPKQNKEQIKTIPVRLNRDIDILVVVDNSGSMIEEQESLARNFSAFMDVLSNIEGGRPNLHIGVVSTDLGAGGGGLVGCSGNGDNGKLQNTGSGCEVPSPERYLIDIANPDDTRTVNYAGTLADSFSCIAKLGDDGCGFEQPLEAMRRALNGSNAENNGFLRPEAFLAVIIITDEDDCSTENNDMFNTNPALNNINSELGFLDSFRCFEFGVQCEPDMPRSPGVRTNCVSRKNSPFMHDVDGYVSFLKGLKEDPGQVIVAGIIGNPTPVTVSISEVDRPTLDASCETVGSGKAVAATRIDEFLDLFPGRNTKTTICQEDLSDALTVIADLLAKVLGTPCIDGDLLLTDGQPECTVSDIRFLDQDNQEETPIATCNADMSNIPCYHFATDLLQCPETETNLTLIVERGNASVPSETTVVAHCLVQ